MEARDSLQDVGRGIAQLHMRLGKLIETVERSATTAAPAPAATGDNRWRDALLDLVDALDTALERRRAAAQPARSRWFWRRPSVDPSRDVWQGLALAAARAHEALAAQGITPMAEVGAFDATQQRAIDTVAALPGEEVDVIVRTHRRGWLRQRGGAREVLRTAHVTVRTRRRRREEKRAKRAQRSSSAGSSGHRPGSVASVSSQTMSPYGAVRAIERCHPPVHATSSLVRIRDPLEVLGLDPTRRASREEVLAAFRAAIEAHPPEREPEVARELIEARDRLARPEHVLERELGVLYPPDPAHYGLAAAAAASEPKPESTLPSHPRLLASLVLYTLLEAELEGPST